MNDEEFDNIVEFTENLTQATGISTKVGDSQNTAVLTTLRLNKNNNTNINSINNNNNGGIISSNTGRVLRVQKSGDNIRKRGNIVKNNTRNISSNSLDNTGDSSLIVPNKKRNRGGVLFSSRTNNNNNNIGANNAELIENISGGNMNNNNNNSNMVAVKTGSFISELINTQAINYIDEKFRVLKRELQIKRSRRCMNGLTECIHALNGAVETIEKQVDVCLVFYFFVYFWGSV